MTNLLMENLYDEELEFLMDEDENFWDWKGFAKGAGRGFGGAAGGALGGLAGSYLGSRVFGKDSTASKIATAIGTLGGATLGRGFAGGFLDREMEWELDSAEIEILSPKQQYDNHKLMEYLGYAAANTESEAEAEAFVGALVPLAARLNPRTASIIKRSSPGFIGGLSAATKILHRNPRTRHLIHTFPTILRRTSAEINRQLQQGKNVTPKTAVNTLADRAYWVMRSP